MTMKIDAKLICCFKNDRNFVNFDLSTQSLKNLHFHWFLLWKVLMLDLNKYRGVIFHDTEEWWKIWRRTELWFGKWHEEYGKCSPEHLKVSKLELWWDLLIQSRKSMRLKFTEELCVTAVKNDTNIWRGIDLSFQNWHEEFDEFDPSTRKSKKFVS